MVNIVLGVTASVAAIKTLSLTQALSQFANVRLLLTEKAQYFLKADWEQFKSLNIPLLSDDDEWPALEGPYLPGADILHIELRRWADCLLIAPLDANTLAKLAQGFCDNLLTSVFRAWDWTKPVILSPAMNTKMWENPPTAQHIAMLKRWGAEMIDPIEKKLACQDFGQGAMAEPHTIAAFVKTRLGKKLNPGSVSSS